MNEPVLVNGGHSGSVQARMNPPNMRDQNLEEEDTLNNNQGVEENNNQRNSLGSQLRNSLRISLRQQNRIDVRNNFRAQIEEAINESIVINALLLFISINKMIAYLVLGQGSSSDSCSAGQLCIWLKLMFLHDTLYSIHLVSLLIIIFIHRHRNIMNRWSNSDGVENEYWQMQDNNNQMQQNFNGFYVSEVMTKKHWFNSFLQDSTKLFYLIIFIQGNLLIFYNEEQYLAEYPNHFYLALVFVVMGYFYLGIPLFFFASICLCMPFMLVMYLVLRRRRHGINRGLDEQAISNLPIKNPGDIERQDDDLTLECCICLVEYEQADEVIILPCNKHHHFHASCIKQWVKINGVCPICKRDLKELVIRMDQMSNDGQIQYNQDQVQTRVDDNAQNQDQQNNVAINNRNNNGLNDANSQPNINNNNYNYNNNQQQNNNFDQMDQEQNSHYNNQHQSESNQNSQNNYQIQVPFKK